jgi:putative nucleotidyltransferase with HDIG domain
MSLPILICSENEDFTNRIKDIVGDIPYNYRYARDAQAVDQIEKGYMPYVAIIEVPQDKANLIKVYDAVYKKFSHTKIICAFENMMPYDPDQLGGKKQSMTFLQLYFENEILVNLMMEYAPVEIPAKQLRMEHLNPISLSDIKPSDKFNFDLYFYMPANRKILLYRRKNSVLSEKQITNFQKFKIHDLYVLKNEMSAVKQYFSKKLKNTFGSKSLSKTEKRLLLQKQVKDIFGSLFNPNKFSFAQSKIAQESCKEIIGQFITEISPQPELYEKILHYTSHNKGNYSHAVNVSVFSSLFAIALGLEDIEAAAIGGLLHDIGVSSMPAGISKKYWAEMTEEEKHIYKTHTDAGVKLMENKKLVSVDNVKFIISQHHERMDGAGYPQGLKKEQINQYARVCQIADELDELTSVHMGMPLLSPAQAFTQILNENSDKLGPEKFDVEILESLKALLLPPTDFKVEAENVKAIFKEPLDIKDPNAATEEDLKRRKRVKKASVK